MTDVRNDDQPERTPDPGAPFGGGEGAGHRRPDQGGSPPGREEADPATGGEGAAGAGGSGDFGT